MFRNKYYYDGLTVHSDKILLFYIFFVMIYIIIYVYNVNCM
jgi:hypothetical protein